MARELAIENGKLKSDLDANGNKVVNLATPTSDNDAATKKYVDEHGVTLDDTVTETSANGVKSSGIWSFVKGLLPSWLTPSREEPPTQASVAAKYTKPSDGIPLSDLKPTTFPPEAHAASHKTGGTDALTPSDIGAVAAVPGKQLSTNDYTTAEKTKLAGIEAGAEVNPTPVAPSTEIDEGATADAKKVAEFVNSSINAMAAFYITKNAAGDAFATKAELTAAIAAGTFYNGGALRTPTKNDYLYVLADESATPIIPGVAPTTRYSYDGAQWAFQIVVNNTALTSAQVAAINSGMTAALVSWLSTFKGGDTSTTLASVLSAIAGKLDKSGDTMTGNLEVTNSDGYPKVLVGDSGGDYAEYQKDGIFTANGWIGFGAKNGTASVEDDFSPSAPAAYVGAFAQKLGTNLAPNFSTSATYSIGVYVTYGGMLFRCKTAITTAGAWDATKWEADSVVGILGNIETALAEV